MALRVPRTTRNNHCDRQVCAGLDFGGSKGLVTVGRRNTDGRLDHCEVFRKWPGRSAVGDYGVPTVVATPKTRKADGQFDEILWGFEAVNALADAPDNYDAHDRIKDWLMGGNETSSAAGVDPEMYGHALFFIESLLKHILHLYPAQSLLLNIAVPVDVEESDANRYLELFEQASPANETTIRISNEATLGGMAIREAADEISTGIGESFSNFKDVSIWRQKFYESVILWKQSLEYGSKKINEVIEKSDLTAAKKHIFKQRLEERKANIPEWKKKAPTGPIEGVNLEQIMNDLVEADVKANVHRTAFIKECCDKVLSQDSGKTLLMPAGGGAGSTTLRELLQRERVSFAGEQTTIALNGIAEYDYQYVLRALELAMKDPSKVPTDALTHNVYLDNHSSKSAARAPSKKPLLVFEKGQKEGGKTSRGLTASFQIYLDGHRKTPVKTKKIRKVGRVAKSARFLKSTGNYEVELPIGNKPQAEIYTYLARFSCTILIVILYNENGEHIEELEKEEDPFEGGIFSGRLKEYLRVKGVKRIEVARVLLPRVEEPSTAKDVTTRKRKRADEVVEISDDEESSESGSLESGFASSPKEAANDPKKPRRDGDSQMRNSSSPPPKNSEEEQVRLYSARLKDHMADESKLKTYLEHTKRFPPSLVEKTDLLQTVKDISLTDNISEDVKRCCTMFLESWIAKDKDDLPRLPETQPVNDTDGAGTTKDSTSQSLLSAVGG